MAATCAGLGDSQAKPSCESRLVAASARPGTTEPPDPMSMAIVGLRGFRKL